MACRIDSLVRESVPILDEGAPVQEGAELMARLDMGSVVVTSGGQVVGLFTERDLLRRVVGAGHDPKALRLGDVCSRDLVTIAHDSSCREAENKMHAHVCRRLLVYRGAEFLGLVKLTDVAHAMANSDRGKDLLVNTLGAITLAVAVGVIAMLLFQLPAMLRLAEQVTGR
jgi:CBS domain-containing protein